MNDDDICYLWNTAHVTYGIDWVTPFGIEGTPLTIRAASDPGTTLVNEVRTLDAKRLSPGTVVRWISPSQSRKFHWLQLSSLNHRKGPKILTRYHHNQQQGRDRRMHFPSPYSRLDLREVLHSEILKPSDQVLQETSLPFRICAVNLGSVPNGIATVPWTPIVDRLNILWLCITLSVAADESATALASTSQLLHTRLGDGHLTSTVSRNLLYILG